MWGDKEKQYKEESRNLIRKTHALATRLDERSVSQGRELLEHKKDNISKFKEMGEKIEKAKCKHNQDVPALIEHVDKQNGSIDGLNTSFKNIDTRLNTLISETTGEEKAKRHLKRDQDRAKETKDIKRNFIIALVLCMFTGIGTVLGIFAWYDGKTEIDAKEIAKAVIELEKEGK